MNTAMTYVADTHALARYVADDPRLSAAARAAFEDAEAGRAKILVPVIALAELGWMIEKKQITLDFTEILDALRSHPSYEITPLELANVECAFGPTSISEMHDRLIACEAKLKKATLITVDANIHASKFVPVLW